MSDDIEVCHFVLISDKEMTVLKLLAEGIMAINEGREMPPHPTEKQAETMLALFNRIKEM